MGYRQDIKGAVIKSEQDVPKRFAGTIPDVGSPAILSKHFSSHLGGASGVRHAGSPQYRRLSLLAEKEICLKKISLYLRAYISYKLTRCEHLYFQVLS